MLDNLLEEIETKGEIHFFSRLACTGDTEKYRSTSRGHGGRS
jgi:hypothetical protein